jgi:hypothetical protein
VISCADEKSEKKDVPMCCALLSKDVLLAVGFMGGDVAIYK